VARLRACQEVFLWCVKIDKSCRVLDYFDFAGVFLKFTLFILRRRGFWIQHDWLTITESRPRPAHLLNLVHRYFMLLLLQWFPFNWIAHAAMRYDSHGVVHVRRLLTFFSLPMGHVYVVDGYVLDRNLLVAVVVAYLILGGSSVDNLLYWFINWHVCFRLSWAGEVDSGRVRLSETFEVGNIVLLLLRWIERYVVSRFLPSHVWMSSALGKRQFRRLLFLFLFLFFEFQQVLYRPLLACTFFFDLTGRSRFTKLRILLLTLIIPGSLRSQIATLSNYKLPIWLCHLFILDFLLINKRTHWRHFTATRHIKVRYFVPVHSNDTPKCPEDNVAVSAGRKSNKVRVRLLLPEFDAVEPLLLLFRFVHPTEERFVLAFHDLSFGLDRLDLGFDVLDTDHTSQSDLACVWNGVSWVDKKERILFESKMNRLYTASRDPILDWTSGRVIKYL